MSIAGRRGESLYSASQRKSNGGLMITEAELMREAALTGFRTEVLEKVIRLLELLETLRMHPFLKPRIALNVKRHFGT